MLQMLQIRATKTRLIIIIRINLEHMAKHTYTIKTKK